MKRIVWMVLLILSVSQGNEYFTKVESLQTYKLKSDVSGRIVLSKILSEGSTLKKSSVIIEIDNELDLVKEKFLIAKIKIMEKLIKIKEQNFLSVKKAFSKSELEKRGKEELYLNSKITLLDMKSSLENLKIILSKKSITVGKGMYIDKINVVEYDYVVPGMTLLTYKDISAKKMNVYVNNGDYNNLSNMGIYVNGKLEGGLKITKIPLVKDSNRISMFNIEIIGELNGYNFGDIVKVEFK